MTTTNRIVLVTGASPLHQELKHVAESNGYHVIDMDQLAEYKDQIELAIEVNSLNQEAKKATIQELDGVLAAHVPIVATSLSVTATEIASWATIPDRVCGFGTFVPLVERELIEVAPALQTTAHTLEQVKAFMQSVGKDTAVVDDEVGLVFPRILSLIINEAVFTLHEGTATREDIDIAMKKGTNYPYGPLEWADRIGLDEVYAVIRGLHHDLAEERYRPAPLLRKLVLAGRVGQRSGQGFYTYEEQKVGQR
ncbi:3-hydroxybutyryl-CoA dehydrogenase [Aneurinibacillus soli]|uniref:Putative 3-hydroxybutyryl-CoA dehydrogenase n=1 Tax=Aneurinibacillus soli TaxID=1500254 RepID=A0A0U5B9F4_9BACL|nr:3-hydroxyacyl-CoA dehydrogenase family protein [Aneurinibacillus soli]PYE60951.1 3-hydroxybutyryl-CoA dehydrogenase [Aneurinibacillus soli]BAU26855.1 putative 3-hydroxybutyryl-CoA dehydrogenase [Aneurinibacillus soli]